MKKLLFCLVSNALLISSCATQYYATKSSYNVGPFVVGIPYGGYVPYGDNRHAGIDFNIPRGTPIIASLDGKVADIGEPCPGKSYCGGIFVSIYHGGFFNGFFTRYGHLDKVFVKYGQKVKRGQLLGLSGANNSGYEHLHFAICAVNGPCPFLNSYNPDKFSLSGEAECFDPTKEYVNYSQEHLTIPIACGGYAKDLLDRIKKKD